MLTLPSALWEIENNGMLAWCLLQPMSILLIALSGNSCWAACLIPLLEQYCCCQRKWKWCLVPCISKNQTKQVCCQLVKDNNCWPMHFCCLVVADCNYDPVIKVIFMTLLSKLLRCEYLMRWTKLKNFHSRVEWTYVCYNGKDNFNKIKN